MIGTSRLRFVVLYCGCLMNAVAAAGEEPKSPPPNTQKIPTKIAGTFQGGELVELRVKDRIAFLIKPTGKVDPEKRWVWDFPFWMAINDGFGGVGHRYYVEKLLAAGFHIAGVDVGASCGSPAGADVCQEFHQLLVSKHGLHPRARLLCHSNGGLLAFSHISPLYEITVEIGGDRAGRRLERDYFDLRMFDDADGLVSTNLPYGEWIRLFRSCGLLVEDLLETRPKDDPTLTGRQRADNEWARRWPSMLVGSFIAGSCSSQSRCQVG